MFCVIYQAMLEFSSHFHDNFIFCYDFAFGKKNKTPVFPLTEPIIMLNAYPNVFKAILDSDLYTPNILIFFPNGEKRGGLCGRVI